MARSPDRLLTFLLPGLEGSGRLFARFQAACDGSLELRALSYPPDQLLDYRALEARVAAELPPDRPFGLLGESFSGPIALRLGARHPAGLVGVVLAATFHLRPAAPVFQVLAPLAPVFFRMPLPRHAVRLLLAGGDAPRALVAEIRSAVASVEPRVMAARAREALQVDATEALVACRAPLLIMAGKHDRLLRREIFSEIQALRPDAEFRTVDAPHLLLQREPEQAARIVTEFLLRCARRACGGPSRS